MIVLAWNVGPRRQLLSLLGDLLRLISAEDDVVALFEVSPRHMRLLRLVFAMQWRVLQPRITPRGKRRVDVVVMVRRRLRRPEVVILAHNVSWIGPKQGLPHKGRAHVQLTWDEERLIFVHRVPGGPRGGVGPHTEGQNRSAWEADKGLIEIAAAGWGGSVAVIGDHNATATELRPEYIQMGLGLVPIKTKVDHAAVRGFPRARGRRLGEFGSDHPAVRWRLR